VAGLAKVWPGELFLFSREGAAAGEKGHGCLCLAAPLWVFFFRKEGELSERV
jgi:hypothetical protein